MRWCPKCSALIQTLIQGFSHHTSATIRVVGEASETLAPHVCVLKVPRQISGKDPGSVGAALAMVCPRVGQGGSGGCWKIREVALLTQDGRNKKPSTINHLLRLSEHIWWEVFTEHFPCSEASCTLKRINGMTF